jgi:hypothetical protein
MINSGRTAILKPDKADELLTYATNDKQDASYSIEKYDRFYLYKVYSWI